MDMSLKIIEAFVILKENLSKQIASITIEATKGKAKFVLLTGELIYITYNNHEEYGYHLLFSSFILDRIRFDNFDQHWMIETRPHHFHPRFSENGYNSPMTGNPKEDIPKLCNLIISKSIFQKEFRF